MGQLGTFKVYHYSYSDRIIKLLQSKQTALTPSQIAQFLDAPKNSINQALKRLKKKGIVQNKSYGLWELVNLDHQHGTFESCGGSRPYQLHPDEAALIKFMLRYDHFHGLESYLPDLDSRTKLYKRVNGWYISLEKCKLRIRSSHNPIPLEDLPKIQGIIEFILAELDYDGPAWLTHIELNKDHEGYKLDGIQRCEIKTILGNVVRLYNKKIGSRHVLRSEHITHLKAGEVKLLGGLQLIAAANNIEDAHGYMQKQIQLAKNIHSELSYQRNLVRNSVGLFQEQVMDISTKQSQILQTIESIPENQLSNQLLQQLVHLQVDTNNRLGTLIQQNELQLQTAQEIQEELRQIKEGVQDWRNADRQWKLDVIHALKLQNLTLSSIANEVGVTRQAISKFHKKHCTNCQPTRQLGTFGVDNSEPVDQKKLDKIRKLTPGTYSKNQIYRIVGGNRKRTLAAIDAAAELGILKVAHDPNHKQRRLYTKEVTTK